MTDYVLRPVGYVQSALDLDTAPRQGDEGAPEAWINIEPWAAEAMKDLFPGTQIWVLTWLDRADRDVLAVHPRGDQARPLTGVFSTRSPHRPNPIGLHQVTVTSIDGLRIAVADLEAIDGTPVIDLKPLLGGIEGR